MPDPNNKNSAKLVAESETATASAVSSGGELWPSLPYEAWKDTYETLHMWTQIVGKIRLALSPMVNHWWQSTLYVTSRGLTTSPIPYGTGTFEIMFDFIYHNLAIHTSEGQTRYIGLHPRSVADFYRELMSVLHSLDIEVSIFTKPQEVPNPIPCDVDHVHVSYDEDYANRLWRILVQTDSVFKEFRGSFLGKCSPVHLWWGSFDLAVTRFSGRRAPERSGADSVQSEAYSHECISAGFWPGSEKTPQPIFYSYTYPAPEGLAGAAIRPSAAYFDETLGEFVFQYDDVRKVANPKEALLAFLLSTYEAGADLGGWDRSSLER